jgi:RNA polymerase sigma factor (sigma-70 family)
MSELEHLRQDAHYYEVIYHQHRVVAYQYLRNLGIGEEQFLDIFQDAVIVLFEKSRDPSFCLTCSVRTYLISICRNQYLKRSNREVDVVSIDGEKMVHTDWLADEEEITEKQAQVDRLERILQQFSNVSTKCYELIYHFFYLQESFSLIAQAMAYSNAENAKNQKARCQKKLRELYREEA